MRSDRSWRADEGGRDLGVLDQEFDPIPRRRSEVAGGNVFAVVGRSLRYVERRLGRLLEEALDAGRG